jgi:hypothetical protein
MRKLIAFLIAFSLILSMSLTALAADDVLTIEDTAVKSGETIYLSVILNQSLTADAIGVRYSYDKSLLEPLPASAIWEVQGLLSDFNNEDSGVWASAEPKALSGRLFTLAFRLKEGATFTESTVTCTVIFKNGDGQGVEHTATGRLYTVCTHSYGPWTTQGATMHSKTCTLCGHFQSEIHNWGNGVTTAHPSKPGTDVITYTCTGCGETKTKETTGANEATLPTIPPTTPLPTQPQATIPPLETMPTNPPTAYVPTSPPPVMGDGNQSSTQSTQPTRPVATQPIETIPIATQPIPTQPTNPTEPAPGYTAPDYNNSQNNATEPTNPGSSATTQPTTGGNAATEAAPTTSGSTTNNQGQYQPPVAVPIPSEVADLYTQPATESAEHDHDHDHPEETLSPEEQAALEEQQTQTYFSSGLALLAAFACIGGAAALTGVLIRRNKK